MFDKKAYMKEWREKYKEYTKKYSREYYIKNREKEIERSKEWIKNNPVKREEYNKLYRINNLEKEKKRWKQYRSENRKDINQRKKYKRKTDLKFNLNHRINTAIGLSLKGNKNGRHWECLINYTLTDLIKRLKSTIPKDYKWKDFLQGKLHIDHILPIRLFQFNSPKDKEFLQCWSLYNLRLLSKEENLSKNDKIINPILLGLLLKEMI